jgi:hypothetical protein
MFPFRINVPTMEFMLLRLSKNPATNASNV